MNTSSLRQNNKAFSHTVHGSFGLNNKIIPNKENQEPNIGSTKTKFIKQINDKKIKENIDLNILLLSLLKSLNLDRFYKEIEDLIKENSNVYSIENKENIDINKILNSTSKNFNSLSISSSKASYKTLHSKKTYSSNVSSQSPMVNITTFFGKYGIGFMTITPYLLYTSNGINCSEIIDNYKTWLCIICFYVIERFAVEDILKVIDHALTNSSANKIRLFEFGLIIFSECLRLDLNELEYYRVPSAFIDIYFKNREILRSLLENNKEVRKNETSSIRKKSNNQSNLTLFSSNKKDFSSHSKININNQTLNNNKRSTNSRFDQYSTIKKSQKTNTNYISSFKKNSMDLDYDKLNKFLSSSKEKIFNDIGDKINLVNQKQNNVNEFNIEEAPSKDPIVNLEEEKPYCLNVRPESIKGIYEIINTTNKKKPHNKSVSYANLNLNIKDDYSQIDESFNNLNLTSIKDQKRAFQDKLIIPEFNSIYINNKINDSSENPENEDQLGIYKINHLRTSYSEKEMTQINQPNYTQTINDIDNISSTNNANIISNNQLSKRGIDTSSLIEDTNKSCIDKSIVNDDNFKELHLKNNPTEDNFNIESFINDYSNLKEDDIIVIESDFNDKGCFAVFEILNDEIAKKLYGKKYIFSPLKKFSSMKERRLASLDIKEIISIYNECVVYVPFNLVLFNMAMTA